MDARPKTRQVNREKKARSLQAPRGARQIVIPMTREQYDQLWPDVIPLRTFVDEVARESPELFPQGFGRGYAWCGYGRASRKLPGVRLRKIVLADGPVYWLRPSFVTCYMTGTVDDLAYPLLLAAYGVPPWLLTIGFGHSDMYWYRQIERLGRNSVVGATVRDAPRLLEHLAADDPHLQAAYRDFAAEARDVHPQYAPETVNTDGWAATRNAFQALFATITVVLCFLHGFLKIRDRCRKHHELHRRVWDVYRAATAEEFRRLMSELQQWCGGQTWTAAVREMLTKLWNKREAYVVAYAHPGCHRTSNAVDRPMNRLGRLLYAGRGLHGHQRSSELRLRGWALLFNFRPFARRSNQPRAHDSPAHRINGKRYHEHWLHNLMTSTSLMGFRNLTPAIR